MGNAETVEKVRAAMKDRARYLACLYRSFAKALPHEVAERLARDAIIEYGRIRAQRDGKKISPEEWVDTHYTAMGAIFESEIMKEEDQCEIHMTYCPLLEEWKELGCSPEEIDLFCDIAMELDRSRADCHEISCEIPERMGKGDEICRVILRR